jgi:Tol biopolymer transport system component
VYYLTGSDELYAISTLGGNPRRMMTGVHSPIAFSSDGRLFAFVRWTPERAEQSLMVSDASGGQPRRVSARKRPEVITYGGVAWSPDGERIAMIANHGFNGDAAKLIEVEVATGRERVIAERLDRNAYRSVWLPDGESIVVESDQLWLFRVEDGDRRRITNDAATYRSTGMSADGKRLVAVQTVQAKTVSIDGKAVHTGTGNRASIGWMGNGGLVILDKHDGATHVWSIAGDGTDPRQLTFGAVTHDHAAVCGDAIVFTSDRVGGSTVWAMNRDGGDARQISGAGLHYGVQCAPDGTWIAYHSAGDDVSWSVWRMALDGRAPRRITTQPATFPTISPDGSSIACNYLTADGWRLAVLSSDGGDVRVLGAPGSPTRRLSWTPDGRHIAFVQTEAGIDNLWRISRDGGLTERITDHDSDRILAFRWSPDGSRLAIVRSRELKYVVTIESFR